MQLSQLRRSVGTCECASSHTKAPSDTSVNISSSSELDKDIDLLSPPESNGIIEGAAKTFGQRHVSTRVLSSGIDFWLVARWGANL